MLIVLPIVCVCVCVYTVYYLWENMAVKIVVTVALIQCWLAVTLHTCKFMLTLWQIKHMKQWRQWNDGLSSCVAMNQNGSHSCGISDFFIAFQKLKTARQWQYRDILWRCHRCHQNEAHSAVIQGQLYGIDNSHCASPAGQSSKTGTFL